MVSLIGGLGRLSYQQARSLGLRGGVLLLLFWGIALLAVLAIAATFPSWTSAAFFTASLAEEAPEAYKDVTSVVSVAHNAGISRIVAGTKPIGVVKG